jgi:hypothetical protein
MPSLSGAAPFAHNYRDQSKWLPRDGGHEIKHEPRKSVYWLIVVATLLSPSSLLRNLTSTLQRSAGWLSAATPCIFLTLLPVQVFPETVQAAFVSQPLPEHKGVVSDAAEAEHRAKHRVRRHKTRRAHH